VTKLLYVTLALAEDIESGNVVRMSQHATMIGRLWWQTRGTVPPLAQACTLVGAKANWTLAEHLGRVVQQAASDAAKP
jgi:hypothetical protein